MLGLLLAISVPTVAPAVALGQSELVGVELVMHPGESIELPIDDVQSFSQSGSIAYATLTPDGRTMIIQAAHLGTTSVLLVLTNGGLRRVMVSVVPVGS